MNVKYERCVDVLELQSEWIKTGCEHGVRMTPFNYTEKKIITKMENNRLIRTEITNVKRNHRNSPKWMKDVRTPGMLYFDDPVDKI